MSSPTQVSTAMLYSQGNGSVPSGSLSNAISSTRDPTSADIKSNRGYYNIGQKWVNTLTPSTFSLASFSSFNGIVTANWTQEGGSGSGSVSSVSGTANQITVSPTTGAAVVSLPSAITTPGSLTTTTSLTATLGAITATNGNFVKGTAGNKDVYSSVATNATAGANSAGSVTLAGGTATVATTAVTASSLIRIYRQGIGSTGAAALGILTIGTITAATSFVINSVQAANATALQASDVSVVFWEIVN